MLQSVLEQCTLLHFQIGKIARDIGADHSKSPHVVWPVIMCCISHFLCTLRLPYGQNKDIGRYSTPQALRKHLPFLMCLVSSHSCCCVLSSDFHESSWTSYGMCMKLLPNVFVGPVRGVVQSADVCHVKQSQAFPPSRGINTSFEFACSSKTDLCTALRLLSLVCFPNWVYLVGHRG